MASKAEDSEEREEQVNFTNDDSSNGQNTYEEKEAPTKVFVGQLAQIVTADDLKELFGKFGRVVECDVIRDYGFVHFAHSDDAKLATKALDGSDFFGKNIKVEVSRSKVRQKPGMKAEGCFKCGDKEHWSKDCPQGGGKERRRDDRSSGGSGGRGGGGGRDRYGGGGGGSGSGSSRDRYGGPRERMMGGSGGRDRYSDRYGGDRFDPYAMTSRERMVAMERLRAAELAEREAAFSRLGDPFSMPPPIDDPYTRPYNNDTRFTNDGPRFDRFDR